jgi:thiamine pyrophosphate-dependent acetolactate synthase large subunit-like protein
VPAPPAAKQKSLPAGVVDFEVALESLNAAMPADRTLVTDLGRFTTSAWRAFPVKGPGHYVHTANFGAIGLGLPEAIGAAFAAGGETVLLVSGDGGFILGGIPELATAAREKLDLVIVICNDASYGAEHVQFTSRSMDPASSLLTYPDFDGIARAMGMNALCVRSREDLEAACMAIRDRSGPLLIDLKLDPHDIPKHY